MLSPKLLTKYYILHNLGPFLVVAVDHVHSLTYRLESGRKGHAEGVIGQFARMLKMAARAKSAANCPNWTEIPSKR